MLVIRMQRTGRKGHAQFRVVVQDSRRTPTSGRIVASLGHFNPHSKETTLDKEKVAFYLEHGAQPSDRVTRLLKHEGVKLPVWVKLESDKARDIRNPEKLRKNRPAEEAAPAEEPKEVAETPEEVVAEPAEEPSVSEAETETAAESAEAPAADEATDAKSEETEA